MREAKLSEASHSNEIHLHLPTPSSISMSSRTPICPFAQKQLMGFFEERLKVIRGKIAELSEIEEYISVKRKRMQGEDKLSNGRKVAKKQTLPDGSETQFLMFSAA
jgi:hypothetical protein